MFQTGLLFTSVCKEDSRGCNVMMFSCVETSGACTDAFGTIIGCPTDVASLKSLMSIGMFKGSLAQPYTASWNVYRILEWTLLPGMCTASCNVHFLE